MPLYLICLLLSDWSVLFEGVQLSDWFKESMLNLSTVENLAKLLKLFSLLNSTSSVENFFAQGWRYASTLKLLYIGTWKGDADGGVIPSTLNFSGLYLDPYCEFVFFLIFRSTDLGESSGISLFSSSSKVSRSKVTTFFCLPFHASVAKK